MNSSTSRICEAAEKVGVREAIKQQVLENRFLSYAEILKKNSGVMAVAKKGCPKATAEYIRTNQEKLNLPMRLTARGCLRVATLLVTMTKGA